MNYFEKRTLLDLFGSFCEDTLSDDDSRALAERLQSDADSRRMYLNYVIMRLDLSELTMTDGSRSDSSASNEASKSAEMPGPSAGVLAPLPSEAMPPPLGPVAEAEGGEATASRGISFTSWPENSGGFVLGAGFAVLLVAAALAWWMFPKAQMVADLGEAGAEDRQSDELVAEVTGTRNCVWATDHERFDFGAKLSPGDELQLAKGLVEVSFRSGARVILEGPTVFRVDTARTATLSTGQLTATVPEYARDFHIAAPGMSVIHQGTSIGMLAEASGAAEVHVFDGIVDAEVTSRDGKLLRTLRLSTNEAARVQSEFNLVTSLVADAKRFVRSLRPELGPNAGLLAYEDFDYPAGPLANQNGGFGWGDPWVDISPTDSGGTNVVMAGSLLFKDTEPSGNHAAQLGQYNRIRRQLATSVGGTFDAAGLVEDQDGLRLVGKDATVLYLSFLQRTSATADVFYGLELHRGDGNANRVLNIGHGAESTGYGASSRYNSDAFRSLGAENTRTNLIVVKFTFRVNNEDTVDVIRNPESMVAESDNVIDATLEGNFGFDRIGLGNFNGTKIHEVDQICVGTSFEAVTGRWQKTQSHVAGLPANTSRVVDWGVQSELCRIGIAQYLLTVCGDRRGTHFVQEARRQPKRIL